MASTVPASPSGPIILYELNEVPWRVVDWYLAKRPQSALAGVLAKAASYTSVTKDEGELHPWSTWPTLHRGVYNSEHKILFINQDRSSADAFPPIWEMAAKAGRRVGVFGSLQSYPPPKDTDFAFYVPDTFAPGAEVTPARYGSFQRLNLRRTRFDSAVASDVRVDVETIKDLVGMAANGLTVRTVARVIQHLIQERQDRRFRKRRTHMQPILGFDIFKRALRRSPVDFATFFSNHVAATMHRYWKHAFPEDFNNPPPTADDAFHAESLLRAMDIADSQIRYLREYVDERGGALVIASSMGQEAINRSYVDEEIRIEDVDQFVRSLGYEAPFENLLAMQPDFNFAFNTVEDAEAFANRINQVTDLAGNPIIFRLYAAKNTISFGLGRRANLIADGQFLAPDAEGRLRAVTFGDAGMTLLKRDKGTGYHQPQGIAIFHGAGVGTDTARREIESIAIAPALLNRLGVASPLAVTLDPWTAA